MQETDLKRLRGMLGFAMRAGKLSIGTEQVIASLRRGGCGIVLITYDASEATKNRISDKCAFYGTEAEVIPLSSEDIGALLGKRSAPRAVAVRDNRFSLEIKKSLGKDVFAAKTEE